MMQTYIHQNQNGNDIAQLYVGKRSYFDGHVAGYSLIVFTRHSNDRSFFIEIRPLTHLSDVVSLLAMAPLTWQLICHQSDTVSSGKCCEARSTAEHWTNSRAPVKFPYLRVLLTKLRFTGCIRLFQT